MATRCVIGFILAGVLLAFWPFSGSALSPAPEACREETPALVSMARAELRIRDSEGRGRWTTSVRLAETTEQRAAGMQHLCPEVVRRNPILFVFPRAVRPQFHMSNVHVPLDILFLDQDRRVVEIAHMPLGPQLVGPSEPIRYALEMAEGEAEARGLRVGDRASWN
ncbi:MAG: DUF192 domain-containing protein [Ectothiorhodospiraceae bacterium]|nr:DUF192 domain-containing protein [Ectothiorhodospiraceae bacterium]